MASQGEDELAPSQTDGFKVSEKKTIDEYTKLGEQSASLVVNPFSNSKPAVAWSLHGHVLLLSHPPVQGLSPPTWR